MIFAIFESATPPDGDAKQRKATPRWVTGGKRCAAGSGASGVTTAPGWDHHFGMATPEPSRPPAAPTQEHAARRVRPAEGDLADIQAELVAGKGVKVTPEELAEWERTGELPASLEARLAACG